jgi:NAD(P)H-hydrate repair Nnr-like enzyme with NAD(P)H-hydrate dehydratase domain
VIQTDGEDTDDGVPVISDRSPLHRIGAWLGKWSVKRGKEVIRGGAATDVGRDLLAVGADEVDDAIGKIEALGVRNFDLGRRRAQDRVVGRTAVHVVGVGPNRSDQEKEAAQHNGDRQ